MVGAGVGMRLFDVETLDELRRKVRGGLGVDGSGHSEQEVEEQWEEWLAETLARRREKEGWEKGSVVGNGEMEEGRRKVVGERGKER